MSGGGKPRDAGPAGDTPPDLFGDAADWDAPLPDLADQAGDGQPGASVEGEHQEPVGVTGPDAGGARSGDAPPADLTDGFEDAPLADLGGSGADDAPDDLWAPVPVPEIADPSHAGDDELLTGLTRRRGRRPRRGRRERATVDGGTAVGADDAPSVRPGTAGSAGLTTGRAVLDRAGASSSGAAARGGASTDPTEDAADPTADSAEPRGLATGGLAGGLEPGTLFANPEPDGAATGRRRKRRRGRKGEDDASTDAGSSGSAASDRPLTAEERLQHALKLAYRHLTKRDRTVSEVRTHLEKREIDETSITAALAELVEFGYLDDERYAARFVEDKRRLEGWGHLRIEQGLRRTGVDREVADRAVAADPLRGDEAELAVEALERRLNGRAPEDDRARQKALRVLATKGYPLDTAYAAVRTYERRCAERDDAEE